MSKIKNLLVSQSIIKTDNNGNLVHPKLEEICHNYPFITLNERQLCDYDMLQNGGFYPLNGFMKKEEYQSCIENMVLFIIFEGK